MVKTPLFKRAKAGEIRGLDDIIISIIAYIIITLFAAAMIYPVLNVAAVSVSTYISYVKAPWMIIPTEFDLSAFKLVLNSKLLINSYWNTLIVTVSGTVLTLAITALMAYPLSRPNFKGKSFIMVILIFTMMFNGGLIPNFLLIKGLGMYNTLAALVIPGILSAFNVILMINFFRALPESLVEAAKIDGASEPYVFGRIILPLSAPILSTIALFAAVGYWNNYFNAIIYIRSQSLWPVQLVLREIVMAANTAMINSGGNMAEMGTNAVPIESLRYAAILIVMLPIMCVYPFLQKYFAKGVLIGAVKG